MDNEIVKCTIFKETIETAYGLIERVDSTLVEDSNAETINLPFWLAIKLQEKDLLLVHSPIVFEKDTINKLEAGSTVVDLRSIHNNFFELAVYSKAYTDDLMDYEMIIENSRTERFHKILDTAQARGAENIVDFKKGLTKQEAKEFDLKQTCEENYIKWKKSFDLKSYQKMKN